MPRFLPKDSNASSESSSASATTGATRQAAANKAAVLAADDRQILLFVGRDLALGGQLLDLALGDHRRRVAEDAQHLEAAIFDHQLERAAEEEVADQNARRIAPDEVGGALAAAHSRAVDDVVVKQRRGVDELDRGGELVVARSRVAEQACAGEREHRPHALSAAGDQVPG